MPLFLTGRTVSEFLPRNSSNTGSQCVHIGIVNNMPDGALRATERQLSTVLESAADGINVRVSLYGLPEIYRSAWSRAHMEKFYCGFDDLWTSSVDGLIVTGTEPRAADFGAEPYWRSLTKVIEWAEENTHSAMWSCLAAHAAVFHQDNIARRKLGVKRFGIFECVRVSDHELAAGLPERLRIPHSRWNEVPEDALRDSGYSPLTRGEQAGMDIFIRGGRSLFVFLQGHPEYEQNTLASEYVRDVGRYLRGESECYPNPPHAYFDADTRRFVEGFRKRALRDRRPQLLTDVQSVMPQPQTMSQWRLPAVRLFRNWLHYLCGRKVRYLTGPKKTANMRDGLLLARAPAN